MSETLDNTIASLNDLTTKTIQSGIEFQGFAKSITQAADTATNAGKKWTVFSRLVSGTPIWAMQNKIRAYLAILGGFEQRSKANAKAMSEQNKKFVDQAKGFSKVNKEFKNLGTALEVFNQGSQTMEEFNEIHKELGLQVLENTLEYQHVLAATNDEKLAAAAAMSKMAERMDELADKEDKMLKQVKTSYAFDEKRIDLAKKLARERELKINPQASEKRLKAKEFSAGSAEKRAMAKEQEAEVSGKGMLKSAITGKGDEGGFGNIKKDFAPILKWVPLIAKKGSLRERMAKKAMKLRLKGKQFADSVKPVLNMAFKYFVFGIMAVIGFMVLAAFLYSAYTELKSMGIFDKFKELGGMIFQFIGMIFETVNAFAQGGVQEGVAKLKELAMFGLDILITTGYLILETGWQLLLVVWDMLISFIAKFFGDAEFRDKIISGAWKIGKWLIIAWGIKYFAGILLTLAGIYAMPIILGVIIFAGIYKLISKYWDPIFSGIKKVITFIAGGLATFIDWLEDAVDSIKDALTDDPDKGWWDENKSLIGLAAGGITAGNYNLVGEKGPELVKLPAGSRVYSNSQSKSMNTGGSTVINNHITINARDTSDAELRRIADKIGTMVNNKMNRTTSSRTMG
tara:strand:+ start:410 stop:2293 length:1884 start_codon:yes stop_codon:yes gene_type:complete